ncbi:DoxX family protein [Streptomyces sp. NPDC059255]|uniref:DoxX family protein n=1 Tax=Streptomyces sp. NPDC059255 TaxID=3346793 RepID=UPI0036988CAD
MLTGLAVRPLGIAAAVGVVLFFMGAVLTHLRAGDTKGSAGPAVLLLVSCIPLIFAVASA